MLDRNFPGSIYNDDALYEIATTYLIINDQPSALEYFDKLVKAHPKSSFAIKSLMRSGLIYYNASQYEPAIKTFKTVIEKYPGSPESKEALASLQKVYVETGNVNEYYDYASQVSFADVSANERDSVTYSVAEMKYLEGNCSEAIRYFDKYLEDFPEGFYSTNANFYTAECYFKDSRREQALSSYLAVLDKPSTQFLETSLVRVSEIYFEDKQYDKAIYYFNQLEEVASYPENKAYARIGIMRCALELGQVQEAIEAGNDLLDSENLSAELINEVRITLARAYFNLGELDNALREYTALKSLVQNEWAAEAQYHIALIQFRKGLLDEAEENVFLLPEKFGSYDYWVANGFILLADIYKEEGNLFQAKQTLQSVIDNYTGPELGDVAREKLKNIERLENEEGNTPVEDGDEF
jgi:TolA-binding protein